jgi:hypothetical protein
MDIEEDTMAAFTHTHGVCAPAAPVSFMGWLMQRLRSRSRLLGNADELPERMRRDMGLDPVETDPSHHYRDYL